MYSRKMRRENHKLTIRRNAAAYCETSTIHGFVYWIEAENNLERCFWIAAVNVTTLTSQLQPYFPVRRAGGGRLIINYPAEWLKSFKSTLDSTESARKGKYDRCFTEV